MPAKTYHSHNRCTKCGVWKPKEQTYCTDCGMMLRTRPRLSVCRKKMKVERI